LDRLKLWRFIMENFRVTKAGNLASVLLPFGKAFHFTGKNAACCPEPSSFSRRLTGIAQHDKVIGSAF